MRRRTGSGQTDPLVVQLKLHKPTIAIGHSLRIRTRQVDSINPVRSRPNKCIHLGLSNPEAEMSNRRIIDLLPRAGLVQGVTSRPVVTMPTEDPLQTAMRRKSRQSLQNHSSLKTVGLFAAEDATILARSI